MGLYDEEVIRIITEPVWNEILARVDANEINEVNMDDFAKEVSPENGRVSGNHLRRMKRKDTDYDKNEMRAIFSDWFNESLCEDET